MKLIDAVSSATSLALLFSGAIVSAQPQAPEADRKLFREIYQELVEINTTDSVGDNTQAAQAMAARLKAAGFTDAEMQVVCAGRAKERQSRRAAQRHRCEKPLLLLAHIDVVEAKREEWGRDPSSCRGRTATSTRAASVDDKAMASIFVANLIRYKQEGFPPDRDIILALTADEELGSTAKWNGANWLVKNHRALIDAEFGLNEGGGGELKGGKPLLNRVQAAEKVSVHFRLEVKNPGGHSSRPRPDNAIYELSEGLREVRQIPFPGEAERNHAHLFFSAARNSRAGQTADDMRAVARDTPDPEAAARLSQSPTLQFDSCARPAWRRGSTADMRNNALPQTARATVNCRILPDDPVEGVLKTIQQVVGDKVTVTRMSEPVPSAPSALRPEVMGPIEKVTGEFWPGVPVVPAMSTGATDSRFMRNGGIPMYGVSGTFPRSGRQPLARAE